MSTNLADLRIACRRLSIVTTFAFGLSSIGEHSANGQEWSDLRIQFVYDAAEAPRPKPIEFPGGDPTCMPENVRPISESLLIDPETLGIRNFLLYPDTKKTAFSADEIYPELKKLEETEETEVVIDVRDCSYRPHLVALRVGQRLKLSNSDSYGHNPTLHFFVNPPESRLLPPAETMAAKPQFGERAPTPIQCNLHPWMKGFVMVADHPYIGISDHQGMIVLKNLPVGKEIVFRVWHESLSRAIPSVSLDGQTLKFVQNRLTIKVEPGGNSLGTIRLPPSLFEK